MTRNDRAAAGRGVVSLIIVAVFLVAACGGAATTPVPASPAPASPAPSSAVNQVKAAEDPNLGAYLTGEEGRSLYLFTPDSTDTSTCADACAAAWPPFEVDSGVGVTAGDGVTGVLATIVRADDGRQQVTYNGIPLYYFAKDAKAGDISGQGVKGVWFLVAPASTAAGGPITGGVGQDATAAPSASVAPSAASGGATAVSAQIAGFAFSPADITVTAGGTVTWTNADDVAHTVTSDDGAFDSGSTAAGATFEQVFPKAGAYNYHCTIHPAMTGTITVTP